MYIYSIEGTTYLQTKSKTFLKCVLIYLSYVIALFVFATDKIKQNPAR